MQMLLLFSHTLSDEQKEQAYGFGVTDFVSLPKELQYLWSNIPPDEGDIPSYLAPLKKWFIQTVKKGDYVLIQGDFGACYHMANFAKNHNAIAVYATTKRVVSETKQNGQTLKTSIFEHIRFREYL